MKSALLSGLGFVIAAATTGFSQDLSDPAEPWATVSAGVTTEVPDPFEPLVWDGQQVSMWGRTYSPGALLPTQIVSQGVSMFRSAPRVLLTVDGNRHVLHGGQPREDMVRDDRIEFSGSQSASTVELQSDAWLEFDGVMRIDLTLSATATTQVDSLSLEFPLQPDVAQFLHYHTVRGGHGNRELPRDSGESLSFAWHAMWWLGDHDRGLSVFTENNFDWSDGPSAVQIERTDDAVVLRFNIWQEADETRTLENPVTFSIGLHATPSKPLPEKWQARYVTFSGGEHLPGSWESIWHQNQRFYSYPQPADHESYQQQIASSHKRGVRVCPYFTSSGTSPDAPVVERHYADWFRTRSNGEPLWRADSVDGGGSGNVSLCSASGYTDFMTWGMQGFLAKYDVDGLYFDNCCPYPCANEHHGCGRDGRSSWPIFANRRFFKRMYAMVKEHAGPSGEQRIIWQHNSRYMVSPALSFVDVFSDGEQFRFDRHSQPLSDISAAFRAMTFTGVQWGAEPCFLPSMASAKPWLTNWGMAATMPYGNILIPAPGWTDFTAQLQPLRVRQQFVQSGQVRFYRPHEIPPWLRVDLELERDGQLTRGEVLTGAYVRAEDNHVLLVVSNLSDEPGALRFNVAAMRQHLEGPIEVADALTGAPSMRANADPLMKLSIAAGTCRMFSIRPVTPRQQKE